METIKGPIALPEILRKNASAMKNGEVRRIIILHEWVTEAIGDFCLRIYRLPYLLQVFNNATVDINFSKNGSDRLYRCLLQNNPYVNGISNLEWEQLDLEGYDVIFLASVNENVFLRFLCKQYGHLFEANQFRPIVYSVSDILVWGQELTAVFPVAQDVLPVVENPSPGELYLSAEEVQWANGWLRSKGLKENEQLFILLDATARREKLLNVDVYFEVLTFLLRIPDSKVLVFDPDDLGKEAFYEAWLEPGLFDRLIFTNKLGLRKDLAILGSSYTKLLFGPCTGLLHCASGIYNHYVRKGMNITDVPLMITYTGKYVGTDNAYSWWGSSPLINCIMLKGTVDEKQLRLLTELRAEERELNDSLACSEYTAEILINFIKSKLKACNPVAEKIY